MNFKLLFFFSCTLNHLALSSKQALPHLLSFVVRLSFHHPALLLISQFLCQLKLPRTQLLRIRSEKKSAWLCGPDPHPRHLCVILSWDFLPTSPCWIPAICSTALEFKCLIEALVWPELWWCVHTSDSSWWSRDGGRVYVRRDIYAWIMMG